MKPFSNFISINTYLRKKTKKGAYFKSGIKYCFLKSEGWYGLLWFAISRIFLCEFCDGF